ncbi:MAG TPA: hypothetical protein VHO25_03050 [Polyangiaceae bacterium]|nr:hypothetical protein [Polyangiaceae bacterium]
MFRSCAAALSFVLGGCSWVVGELPGPLPDDAGTGQIQGSSGATSVGGTANGDPPDASDAGASGSGSVSAPDAADDASPSTGGDAGFDPCDRDGDGEPNEGCGGEDCDDDDRRAHPGQEEYFDQESETVVFDYNCSGQTEREYPTRLSCSLEACGVGQGFVDDPLRPCGEEGAWGECATDAPIGLMCEPQINEMRRVACH